MGLFAAVVLTAALGVNGEVPSLIVERGAPILLSWSHPTMRIDRSLLPVSQIKGYEITWICDTGRSGTIPINSPVTSYEWNTTPAIGMCDFRIMTIDTSNQKSAPSTPYTILVKLGKPARGGMR